MLIRVAGIHNRDSPTQGYGQPVGVAYRVPECVNGTNIIKSRLWPTVLTTEGGNRMIAPSRA